MKIPEYAVFDVETKSIGNPYEIELSAIAIIMTNDGRVRYYTGDAIEDGIRQLVLAERLAGFNSIAFDVPVCLKYMPRGEGKEFKRKPHWDPLHEMQRLWSGQRAPLDNFCSTTFGISKMSLETSDPIRLYRNDPELLERYNVWDTYLTYLLLLHSYTHGYIEFKLPVVRKLHFENMIANRKG